MFANHEDPERDPINIYKLYAQKRPVDFSGVDDPFYLAPRTIPVLSKSDQWFTKMKIGEKKMGGLLKTMAADASLDSKRLTNHSARKHLVKKLRDSGVAPTDIMQISGHKNIQSVLNYSEMSEPKHKECSNILANSRSRKQKGSNPTPQPPPQPSGDANSKCVLSESRPASEQKESNLSVQNSALVQNPIPDSSVGHTQNDCFSNNTNQLSDMQSLFSGSTLNVQNLNVYMR